MTNETLRRKIWTEQFTTSGPSDQSIVVTVVTGRALVLPRMLCETVDVDGR